MKYDFESIIDRSGKDSIAADVIPIPNAEVKPGFDRINMWVADMSFATAPAVIKAIGKRLENPTFGYFTLSDQYFDSIISWQARRNGVTGLEKEHIGYENGVLGGVSSALRALTCESEKILIHSPTYVGFTGTLQKTGRIAIHSELVRDADGVWRMDFDDMDRKIRENGIKVAIFCSPHNPCGRVWEKWEIEKAMEVFEKNHCTVISDEIWSDIIAPGYKHIPTQSVSAYARENTVAMYAPSKTFSIAGLIGSYHLIYNNELREKVENISRATCYNDCNVLSMHALIGAYSREGEEWVEEMRRVIADNTEYICGSLNGIDGICVMPPQGTYMIFPDCSEYCKKRGVTIDEIQKKGVEVGVIWQDGRTFLYPDSIRMNAALPRSQAVEAMRRLKEYVFTD